MKTTDDIDLNDIQVFVKVVECGSFTAAGEQLFLPKSSISRKVSRLEKRLGVRLLQRTTRSLTLTAAGRTYFDRTSRLMAELQDVDSRVAGLGETPCGPLRITVPVTFLETGRGLFAQFLRQYPDIRLAVEITDRYVDLVEEGFDLAIRGGRPPDPSLTGHLLLDTEHQLVASPEYLDKRGRPNSPRDLKDHECLILGMKSPAVWTFRTSRGEIEVSVNGRFACSNVQALLEAAREGMGVARLPTTRGGFNMDGLEIVLPDHCVEGGGLWIVYPSSLHLSPAVRAFIEFLNEIFGEG